MLKPYPTPPSRYSNTVRSLRIEAEGLLRQTLVDHVRFPQGFQRFEPLVQQLMRVEAEQGSVPGVLFAFHVTPRDQDVAVKAVEAALGVEHD